VIVHFSFHQDQQALIQEARDLAGRFSLDYWRERDRTETYPDEFVEACINAGWYGTTIPEEYGGRGLGVTEAGLILHEICASGAGTSGASPVHLAIFPPMPLVKHGSHDLKQRFLPGLAAGSIRMSFGVTEAEAGTDTSRISTTAERNGDGWWINGVKAWLSNGQHAQHALILARTSPRNPERPLTGLTLFFIDLDADGCSLKVIDKMGRNAVDSNVLTLKEVEVADDRVVGQIGQGFYHLLDGLNPERIVIAMEAVGIGRAALRIASEYAVSREVFGRPIGQNQAIAHPLARAWAELSAAELLALKAAWLYDIGEPCGAEANAAKYLAAEASCRACDAAIQTLGGNGYRKDHHVERLWREARLYKIAPISQEMVLNFVSEHVLGLPKSY
jgi:acyl-CoA dehydrogenase